VKEKDLLNIALGIITSIGGFLEVGSMATSAASGADFGYRLIWVIAFSTLCLIFLIEMSGRFAAVSKRTLVDAVRERFGFVFTIIPRTLEILVNLLVLAAEIGGVCLALKLVTGIPVAAWALPVGLLLWIVLWLGTLEWLENTTAILGFMTVGFVVAAWKLHPDPHEVLRGLIPHGAPHDSARYWFLAVSIAGSTISPYMFTFYSSGAVEEKWDEESLTANRMTSIIGMGFGCLMSIGVLIVSAIVFAPRSIHIDSYEQLSVVLSPALGRWGFPLFVGSLAVCCFGAAIELALSTAYMLGQTFGWNWSENSEPTKGARFALTYTVVIFLGALIMCTGLDPLKLTMFSMALTAVILPAVVVPFLLLVNDEHFVGKHRSGWIGNTVVVVVVLVASVIAIVAIPLELAGGS
jgi:Mn2+/Fe2+ NRAMP family transporter